MQKLYIARMSALPREIKASRSVALSTRSDDLGDLTLFDVYMIHIHLF